MESANQLSIALFTIECSASAPALQRILEQNKHLIRLVVSTSRYGKKHGGFLKQAVDNYSRSGFKFLMYLGYSFVSSLVLLRLRAIWGFITRRTPKQRSIKSLCEEFGIHYARSRDINEAKIVELLKSSGIDLITMFYFDQVVHEKIIALPQHGVVNFHPAILPECRGLFPIVFSAVENECRFGVTAHDVPDRGIDTGNILGQIHVDVGDEKSILKIERVVNLKGADLYRDVVTNLVVRRQESAPQDETTAGYFSYPSRQQIAKLSKLGFQLASLIAFWKSQKSA